MNVRGGLRDWANTVRCQKVHGWIRCIAAGLVLAGCAIASIDDSNAASEARPVTTSDVIEMRRLSRDSQQSLVTYNEPVPERAAGLRSPDGRQFAIVTDRGDLKTNTNEYTLSIFTPGTAHDARPVPLVSMRSTSNRPGIQRVQWLDNTTLAFLGERENETQQLYKISRVDRKLEQLTTASASVLTYSISQDESTVFYITENTPSPLPFTNARASEFVVDDQALSELVMGTTEFRNHREGVLFRADLRTGVSRQMSVAGGLGIPMLWTSPDGHHLLVETLHQGKLPAVWREYTHDRVAKDIRSQGDSTTISLIAELTLLDAAADTQRSLLAAPVDRRVEAIWSRDGKSVLVSQVFLPLDVADPVKRNERRQSEYVAKVNVVSGEIEVVARGKFHIATWNQAKSEVALTTAEFSDPPKVADRLLVERGNRWVREDRVVASHGQPEYPRVEVREGINESPKLYYAQTATRRRLIWDLNPTFASLAFGHVEEISFETEDGRVVRAGLYMPVPFVPGEVYPLVIQTHGWDATRFAIDGPGPTAFAAQPFAGRGYVVAQLPDDYAMTGHPQEVPEALADIKGVISCLTHKGLVDAKRTAIIGWSRTGLFVEETLTQPSFHFAAATINETSDAGYFRYVSLLNQPMFSETEEEFNGEAMPYGAGLHEWIGRSPDFNLDAVTTPVWMSVHSEPSSLFGAWEWFVGLRHLGKPVELIYMVDGAHSLVRPAQRLVSLDGNVDWFEFWLNGRKDPDPRKAEQYKRWDAMRTVNLSAHN